ncbi:hypothetical protein V3481_006755 [Fusarium oxysporum f. sp. vasinfectum]
MAPTESLQQFEKIEEVVARYAFKLSSVRSPAEIYKEKTVEIRGRIAQLWTSLELTPAPEKSSLQDSIVKLGGQLKELEIKYEAGVQEEEKAYNRALQEIADAFRYELLEIIGPTGPCTRHVYVFHQLAVNTGPCTHDISSRLKY